MSLGAMRRFKEATGKGLWSFLQGHINNYIKVSGGSVFDVCHKLHELSDFDDAAQAFYCMAKECNSHLTLDEIEDAMFHVGWRPSERDDDMSDPYCIVLYQLALDVDASFEEIVSKKKSEVDSSQKPDTTSQ